MIYLDYAATTPLRREVLAEMMPYWTEEFGNPDSLHACGRRAAYALRTARDSIAELAGVSPSEVYFTSGGTEADNWAVRGIACDGARGGALLSPVEHAAVHVPAARFRSRLRNVFRGGGRRRLPRPCPRSACARRGHVAGVRDGRQQRDGLRTAGRGARRGRPCLRRVLLFRLRAGGLRARSEGACGLLRRAVAVRAQAGRAQGRGRAHRQKGRSALAADLGGEQERGLRGGTSNVAGAVGFACALRLAQQEREEFVRHTGSVRTLFEQRIFDALGRRGAVRTARAAVPIFRTSRSHRAARPF